jgi:hypothetical protein
MRERCAENSDALSQPEAMAAATGVARLLFELIHGARQPADGQEKGPFQFDFASPIVEEPGRRLGQMRPIACIGVLDGAMVARAGTPVKVFVNHMPPHWLKLFLLLLQN